jgi:hypothetical protein
MQPESKIRSRAEAFRDGLLPCTVNLIQVAAAASVGASDVIDRVNATVAIVTTRTSYGEKAA